jgi:hypothetical protein
MVEIHIEDLIRVRHSLLEYQATMENTPPQTPKLWESTIKSLTRVSQMLLAHGEKLGLTETVGRCNQFIKALHDSITDVRFGNMHLRLDRITDREIIREIRGIHTVLDKELEQKKFVFIPPEKAKYFKKIRAEALFGAYTSLRFMDAENDIRDAGNSLAANLYDAAAFYLMRVAETGLRELAKKLKISFSKTPIGYAGWAVLVKAIDDKLSAKMPKARSKKQSAALKFKHDLLADFKAFEVARNEIMHGRSKYNEQEAIDLFNRVRDFMIRLANEI